MSGPQLSGYLCLLCDIEAWKSEMWVAGTSNHSASWTPGDLGNDKAHRNKRPIVVEGTFLLMVVESTLLPGCRSVTGVDS